MTAQGLSVAGFLLSCPIWYTIILGLPAVVIMQVAWCCEMNKCGLNTAGVFMAISGAAAITWGGLAAAWGIVGLSFLGFIGGALYIASAVCTFLFTCSWRYDKYHGKSKKDGEGGDVEQGNATVSNMAAIADIKNRPSGDEVSEMNTAASSNSITKTIYHLPDGSIRTDTEITLPDGTKQVTTTIEHPDDD
jgi:hypothetical protein